MNALEAFMLIVYILTSMLVISAGIIAMSMEDFAFATVLGSIYTLCSIEFAHEYKRGLWR